jgi:hypothetical protein
MNVRDLNKRRSSGLNGGKWNGCTWHKRSKKKPMNGYGDDDNPCEANRQRTHLDILNG